MMAGALAVAGGLIGRARARELARHELARSLYQPSLLQRLWNDFQNWLSSLSNGTSTGSASPLAIIGAVVVVLAVVAGVSYWLGPTRLNRQARARPVLEGRPLTAGEHRLAAGRLAADGDFAGAIIERVRAIAVDLEAREILLPRPSRTAVELAAEAGQVIPAEAGALAAATRLFDEVRYGGKPGSPSGYQLVRELDLRISAAPASSAAGALLASGKEPDR
jgi:hypothetical protein